jgi:CRISPR-associated protein Cmr6
MNLKNSYNDKNSEQNARYKVYGKIFFVNKEFLNLNQINAQSKTKDEAKSIFFKNSINNSIVSKIESISLLFNKYIPIIDAEIQDLKNGKKQVWYSLNNESIGGDSKKLFLSEFIEIINSNNSNNQKILKEFCYKLKERVEKQKESLKKIGYEDIFSSKLKTAYRLVVGLGSGSVFETSLTLHHIFGIPYIPASALKGVVRSVSFWEIAKSEMKKNENFNIEEFQKKLYDENISNSDTEEIIIHKILFGTQEFKGLLIFLDSYPEINKETNKENNKENNNFGIFELDVMTPHYQKYYTENQIPGDWENPNPITFLTVKKGIPFEFNVLIDKHRLQEIEENKIIPKNVIEKLKNYEYLRNKVKRWLELALKEFGVGAKTRLGYGIFQEN